MLPRPGGVDRGAHPRGREVGRPHAAASAPAPGSWRERALRAEAERDAAARDWRTRRRSSSTRARELERGLAETRESLSWRLTAPLRWFGGAAAGRRPRARAARPMIAFGSVDHRRRRPTAATPSPASGAPPKPDSEVYAVRARSGRSAAATTCCSTPPRRTTDLEALVLVDPRAEIADPDFCAQGARGAARPRGRGRRPRRRERRPHDRLVGGRGELRAGRPPLPRARRRRDGRLRLGPPRRAARRGRLGRRLPARAVAVGGARRSASTSRCTRATATTSTTASRSAPPAARWSPPTSASIHHRPLELLPRHRGLDRGPHPGGRAVGRPLAGARRRAGRLEARAPAAPRPSARRRGRSPTRTRSGSTREVLALERAMAEVTRRRLSWRVTAPLRRLNRAAPRWALVLQRAADLVLRDDATAPVAMPARGRAAATAARRPRTRSTRAGAAARPPGARGAPARATAPRGARAPARAGARGWPPGARAAGCDPTGRGCGRARAGPRRGLVPDHAEAEEDAARRRAGRPRGRRRSPRRRSARRCAGRPRAPPSAGRAARRGAGPDRPGRCRRASPASGWR